MSIDLHTLVEHEYVDDCDVCRAQQLIDVALLLGASGPALRARPWPRAVMPG